MLIINTLVSVFDFVVVDGLEIRVAELVKVVPLLKSPIYLRHYINSSYFSKFSGLRANLPNKLNLWFKMPTKSALVFLACPEGYITRPLSTVLPSNNF